MPLPLHLATATRAAAVLAIVLPAALALLPLPHGALFMPEVAAVEWGHWLVPPAAVLFATRSLRRRRIGKVELALAGSMAVLVWPAWAAGRIATLVPTKLDTAFGPSGLDPDLGYSWAGLYSFPRRGTPPVEIDPGNGHRYDLYRPASDGPVPLVVFVHGGSWRSGDRHQLPDIDHDLAARGLAVLEIEYALAPAHTFPAPLADIHAALAWVLREGPARGLDPARVVLVGRSAGAQLALLAAYAPDVPFVPRGVVGLYGPTDLVWAAQHPGSKAIIDTIGLLTDYLGGSLDACRGTYERASPLRQARADSPPTLLIYGSRDKLVSPFHGHRLAGVLSHLGVAHVHLELPWGRHVCEANPRGPGGQVVLAAIERFARAVCR